MNSFSQKIYRLLFCISLLTSMTTFLSAQPTTVTAGRTPIKGDQTITLFVPGVCEMCKARIESTTMDVAGVKKAEWDIKTDTLVVVGSAKMDKQKIADALAKAGYRSELAAADPKGYKKLPACCQYDSGAKKD
ncbi:MAG: heavy metal-associated domain-containing protein [Saprospiraceae bacterium]